MIYANNYLYMTLPESENVFQNGGAADPTFVLSICSKYRGNYIRCIITFSNFKINMLSNS